MRLLRFFLIFAGVAILVIGSIFWINRETFITVFQNRTAILEGSEWVEKTYSLGGLIEFMAEQPQHAAMISISTSPGRDAIRYQSDRMHPAGTLSNLFLVITYAEQAAAEELDPGNRVDVDKIMTFYLPGLDRRHQQEFERWIEQAGDTPTVEQLMRYLITHNDPAVADYLFFYLGEECVTEWTSRLGNGYIEPPVPQFGLRVNALEPYSGVQERAAHIAELSQKKREDFINDALAEARSQWNDPRPVEIRDLASFQNERALNNLYPRIRPDRFAELLIAIRDGSLINPETSSRIRDLIRVPVEDPQLEPHVTDYAAYFDERMGFFSGWTTALSSENENYSVQVIILEDLPAGLWFHMNSNFMVRDYHHRMLYDRAMWERSRSLLIPSTRTEIY